MPAMRAILTLNARPLYDDISEYSPAGRYLTLRNQLPLLKWVQEYGYEQSERKKRVWIDPTRIDVDRDRSDCN